MLRRFPCTRLLSTASARNGWNFLPRVETAPQREVRVPPPPLPLPKYLDVRGRCTLEYVDIPNRRGHEAPVTIVLVHGAPGSYSDFRHLIPVLHRHSYMRIIGINLPGYAGSSVVKEHYLESISALPAAELALEAVKTLCGASDSVFLVGHSFGAHTVINMAALHAVNKHSNAFNVRGMALLAPAGCRPHKVLQPRESAIAVNLLRRDNPFISAITPHFIKAVYTRLLKFSSDSPPGHYIAGLVRAGTTDFSVVQDQVDILRAAKLPSLVAWSQNDEFMEEEIPAELAQLCHFGPRLAFAGGGHNVQKTRAEQVADEMSNWIQEVLNSEEATTQPTKYLP